MNTQTNPTADLLFIEDAAHGWLRVPLADLATLGIEAKITSYSFVSGPFVYLEEDVDLTTYLKAHPHPHPSLTLESVPTKYYPTWPGRNYARYSPPTPA